MNVQKGPRTIRLIHIILHGCLEQAKRLGLIYKNPTEFSTIPRKDVGTPIGADRITHEFHALTRMAGLPVIRLHDCRHTAATIMRNLRIPPIVVVRMLGHSISILLTTYAHFIPTMQDQVSQLMDDILTPIPIDLKSLNPKS